MGKAGKKRRSDIKRAAKKATKRANYLRCGPKADRQEKKKNSTLRPKKKPEGHDASPTPPGSKAKRRSQGLAIPSKAPKGTKRHSKLPLRPLRKRRQWGSARPDGRRPDMAESKQ